MPPADPDDALAAVADELYALAPEDFTAARNARAKAAQSDGDRDLAAAIRTLAKPSVAAGLANQLVRRDRSALDPLLELGVALRDATERLDGAELRTLSRQQAKVVAGLVRRAGELSPSGKRVSPGVAEDLDATFRAAIADTEATDLLMGGCLTAALQHNGFGLVAPGNLTLVPRGARASTAPRSGSATAQASAATPSAKAPDRPSRAPTKPTRDELRVQRLGVAEEELSEAQAAAETAHTKQVAAAAAVEEAQGVLAEAKDTLDEVREQLERAKFALSRAEGGLRQAKQSQDQVERVARAAKNALEDAVAKVDRLTD